MLTKILLLLALHDHETHKSGTLSRPSWPEWTPLITVLTRCAYFDVTTYLPLHFGSILPSASKKTGLQSKLTIHFAAGSYKQPTSSQGLNSQSDLGSTLAT